jgi:hypothetical protein
MTSGVFLFMSEKLTRAQERLAAAQAAEAIVRQSLNAGGGRMTGNMSLGGIPRR